MEKARDSITSQPIPTPSKVTAGERRILLMLEALYLAQLALMAGSSEEAGEIVGKAEEARREATEGFYEVS